MKIYKNWKIYEVIKPKDWQVDFVVFNYKRGQQIIQVANIKINFNELSPEQCNLTNLRHISHAEFKVHLL